MSCDACTKPLPYAAICRQRLEDELALLHLKINDKLKPLTLNTVADMIEDGPQ